MTKDRLEQLKQWVAESTSADCSMSVADKFGELLDALENKLGGMTRGGIPDEMFIDWTDGDAISREAVFPIVAKLWPQNYDYESRVRFLNELKELPSIPVSAPKYGDADVVEGILFTKVGVEFETGSLGLLMGQAFGKHFQCCIPPSLVAAMLNAADTITWPEGHPRNPKPEPEPTLLEAAKSVYRIAGRDTVEFNALRDAIAREEGKPVKESPKTYRHLTAEMDMEER